MAKIHYTERELKEELANVLMDKFGVKPDSASDSQFYEALAAIVVPILVEKRRHYTNHVHSVGQKQVYYISMEFLMGRSLKTNLFNLGLTDKVEKVQGIRRFAECRIRARARRRSRKRRSRKACRLLSRRSRDRRLPRDRLLHSLRIRHLPPEDRRRLAGRAARQLAPRRFLLAGPAPRAADRDPFRRQSPRILGPAVSPHHPR